jgi:TPR repeat protein
MDKYENRAMELESGIAAFETKNFAHAFKLLSPIADEGNVEAMYRMAIMLQNGLGCQTSTEKAFTYMQSAAFKDYPLAQHAYGFMFFEGECTEKDIDKSIEWFTKAANQGLMGSATTLAMIYEEGKLVPQDLEKSQYWYKKAGIEKS